MNALKRKHIIIFGGSSGMGQAVLRLCHQKGAYISACARRHNTITRHLDSKDNLWCESVDVRLSDSVEAFVQNACHKFGQPDYVVNCAGVMYYQLMTNRHYQEWLDMVDTNVKGLLNILYALLPGMIEKQSMMVNITSDAGRNPFPGLAVYSGTKAFMEYTLKALRQELIEHGVKLLNIQPGNVNTPLQRLSSDESAIDQYASYHRDHFLNPEDVAANIVHMMQQPDHVAINELLIDPKNEPI